MASGVYNSAFGHFALYEHSSGSRTAEEREAHEAEIATMRQEDEIKMLEDRARKEAGIAALAESLGLPPLVQ